MRCPALDRQQLLHQQRFSSAACGRLVPQTHPPRKIAVIFFFPITHYHYFLPRCNAFFYNPLNAIYFLANYRCYYVVIFLIFRPVFKLRKIFSFQIELFPKIMRFRLLLKSKKQSCVVLSHSACSARPVSYKSAMKTMVFPPKRHGKP